MEWDFYYGDHTKDEMVNLYINLWAHKGCSVRPEFGVKGRKVTVYRRRHAEDNMVNIWDKCCTHKGCSLNSTSGVEGKKVAL